VARGISCRLSRGAATGPALTSPSLCPSIAATPSWKRPGLTLSVHR